MADSSARSTNKPTSRSEPFHPPKGFTFPRTTFGSRSRSCQYQWFENFDFLHYDIEKDAIFCATCVRAVQQKKILKAKRPDPAFISLGFSNWKDGTAKIRKHEVSEHHREANEAVHILPKQTRDIGEQLDIGHASKKSDNRKILLTILGCIRFLARQGLPLRGDGNEQDSNFKRLLFFEARDDNKLQEWLSRHNDTYTSKDIQNEILKLMALKILREIGSQIKHAKFYTIMADETTDSANREQVVLVFRRVDDDLNVHEDFVGLHEVDNTRALTIVEILKSALLAFDLDIHKLRGQCYDGASTMSGMKTGVAKQIQKEEPKAIYTHCYGHSLNLAAGDMIKGCKVLKNALDTTLEISKLIKFSPKRDAIFRKIKDELHPETPGIRVLCPTRWTVRAESLKSVLENYSVLMEFWEEALDAAKESEMRARINGVASQMGTFDFFFGTCLGEMLLRHADNLSKVLQKKDLSAAEGQHLATMVKTTLQALRTDPSFDLFWQSVTSKAQQVDVSEPSLPRRRKVPRRFEVGESSPEFHSTPANHYRAVYFEALDLLIQCITNRFDQQGYKVYSSLENLLLKGGKGLPYHNELKAVMDVYHEDLDPDKLALQFNIIAPYLDKEDVTLTAVVKYLQTFSKAARSLFSEIVTLVELVLVMPATNATSERSFSSLRRIKSYLRSTMTQLRLNNLMILNVHKEAVDKMRLKEIGNDFVSGSEYRLRIFGSFS